MKRRGFIAKLLALAAIPFVGRFVKAETPYIMKGGTITNGIDLSNARITGAHISNRGTEPLPGTGEVFDFSFADTEEHRAYRHWSPTYSSFK